MPLLDDQISFYTKQDLQPHNNCAKLCGSQPEKCKSATLLKKKHHTYLENEKTTKLYIYLGVSMVERPNKALKIN